MARDHFAKNMLCNFWLAFGSHNRQYVATVSTYKIYVKCLNKTIGTFKDYCVATIPYIKGFTVLPKYNLIFC